MKSGKTRIYLDNCCFNRPFDDQQHPIIRLETEAKLQVQHLALLGDLSLVWSFILHYENNDNPFIERKNQIVLWENVADCMVIYSEALYESAELIMEHGIKAKDALHIASAIEAEADYFITTDKKLLNKDVPNIVIIDPIDFLRRHYYES